MTGEAGAGKTTALNRLAMILLETAMQSSDPSPIPVCLTVHHIAKSTDKMAIVAGDSTREFTSDQSTAFDSQDLIDGRVVLLIDGLDEIGDSTTRHDVLERIAAFHDSYPNSRAILASRDYSYILEAMERYRFTRFHVSPISFRQAGKMIARLSKGQSLSKEATQEALRRLENVHGLELNPLLVTVFVATSDYSRSDIPANITELFKKFTEMMLGRWHRTKGVGHQYHAPLKDFLLQRVAFQMHSNRVTSLSIDTCKEIIQEELRSRGYAADLKILFDEIVLQSGLLRMDGDEVQFRHHLLQEFFAGRGIPSVDFLKSIVTDVWWTKAIVFYFGQNPEDYLGLLALREGVEQIIGGDQLQAAVAVGLAAQACYLMKTDEKRNAIRWVIERLSAAKSAALKEFSRHDETLETFPVLYYYLYGRDAVAGTVIAELAKEMKDAVADDDKDKETMMFWCIAGLIESRQLDIAQALLKHFAPSDARLLLALHLGSFYVKERHVTSKELKKQAEMLCSYLLPKVSGYFPQVMKELKGMVLELRQGKIEALDDDISKEASNNLETEQ